MCNKRQFGTREFLAHNPLFILEDAVKVYKPRLGTLKRSRVEIQKQFRTHIENKELKLIDNELYAVVQPGVDPEQLRIDPFLAAYTLRHDGVFAQHAALQLLGVTKTVWPRITMFTTWRRPVLRLPGTEILFLTHPKTLRDYGDLTYGTTSVEYGGKNLQVTGPERTLIEGFRNLDDVGGLEELVASASKYKSIHLYLLRDLLVCYNMRTLWSCVGWFLKKYQLTFYAKDAFLKTFAERGLRSKHFMVRSIRAGTLDKQWNLIVPDSMQKFGDH